MFEVGDSEGRMVEIMGWVFWRLARRRNFYKVD